MGNSGLWIPKRLKPAVKRIAIVFYHNKLTDHILVGFPEEFPIPPILAQRGYEKVVCRLAHDVDRWSEKMRQQERREEEMTEEQRDAIEGPIRAAVRADLRNRMANSRNAINREFCRMALQKMDEDDERKKMRRLSWMHCEAAEDGH